MRASSPSSGSSLSQLKRPNSNASTFTVAVAALARIFPDADVGYLQQAVSFVQDNIAGYVPRTEQVREKGDAKSGGTRRNEKGKGKERAGSSRTTARARGGDAGLDGAVLSDRGARSGVLSSEEIVERVTHKMLELNGGEYPRAIFGDGPLGLRLGCGSTLRSEGDKAFGGAEGPKSGGRSKLLELPQITRAWKTAGGGGGKCTGRLPDAFESQEDNMMRLEAKTLAVDETQMRNLALFVIPLPLFCDLETDKCAFF